MKGTGSLQKRLGIGLAVGVTVMWLLATLGTALVVRHELDEAFDSNLQEAAQRLLPLAVIDIIERGEGAGTRTVTDLDDHDEYLTYLVRDVSGEILLRSHDVEPAAFPPTPSRGFRETATHRLYGEAAISGTVYIEVAEPLAYRREATFEAVAVLFFPLLVFLPVSLLGVWWFVRRNMRPVLAFGDEIETRGGSDLSPLKAHSVPDEIAPLADAVNRLLDRLRRTLEAERSFTANSAHELRTPIAATLAQTQRLLADVPEGAVRKRAQQIEASLRDLTRLSEKLMQLAQAEGGGVLSEYPQDLSEVLVHVIDDFQRQWSGRRLFLDKGEDVSLVSHMDSDAFGILMRNLIENALKHGDPGEPVEISVLDDRRVSVVNSSPVVPEAVLARLTKRFERGTSDVRGSGLGLAIAEAIMIGAGGEFRLRSPATGRKDGFEAVVRLPG